MRKDKAGVYKVTGITKDGERVSAFVFANYGFQAVYRLEDNLGIKMATATISGKPVEFDVWQNSVTKS
jgi:hypothetical protein